MSGDVPDYNERLAFGTDQGRWLQAQVGSEGPSKAHRRTNSGGRVFHDLDSLQPDPSHSAQQAQALHVDTKFQRLRGSVFDQVQGMSSKTIRLASGAMGVMLVLFLLTRFV
mmetsp:Transcript_36605/g.96638  ORF Transcript_36605/g.96638 Transcript_36605/m.96638 type:complete len:111 (-) Transcript_36605:403-735(-)